MGGRTASRAIALPTLAHNLGQGNGSSRAPRPLVSSLHTFVEDLQDTALLQGFVVHQPTVEDSAGTFCHQRLE